MSYLFGENGSLKIKPPEVIFLDIHLGKITGLDLLQIIRSHPQTKDIPIVVMESSNSPREHAECERLGVKRFIEKPLDYANFMSAIKDINKD